MVVVEAVEQWNHCSFKAKKRQVPDVKERADRISYSGEQVHRDLGFAVLNPIIRISTAVGKQRSSSLCQSIINAAIKMARQLQRSVFTRWDFWRTFLPALFFFWQGTLPSHPQFASLKTYLFLFLPTFCCQSLFFLMVCSSSFTHSAKYLQNYRRFQILFWGYSDE